MVKRLFIIVFSAFILSSCAFFGSSVFPIAESMNIGWFTQNGSIRNFYILDNGEDEPLLFLVKDDGDIRVLIFDTALNVRGYMAPDEEPFILTDGVGFVDHNSDFVIGITKISRYGSTGSDSIEDIGVPFPGQNAGIIPYTDNGGIEHYIRMAYSGDVDVYDSSWIPEFMQILPITNYMVINQSDLSLNDVKIARNNGGIGEVYTITKEALFNHANSTSLITTISPDFTMDEVDSIEMITRCSRGYLISMNYGEFILLDFQGLELGRIQNNDNWGKYATIDYYSEYYYYVDENNNVIRKERVPF